MSRSGIPRKAATISTTEKPGKDQVNGVIPEYGNTPFFILTAGVMHTAVQGDVY